MESELLQMLSAGGDVGILVLVGLAWKFDKRVSKLEWEHEHGEKKGKQESCNTI